MLLVSTKDQKSLCLVNKTFNSIATKLLWREPHLKYLKSENIEWISKKPIQVLDITNLIRILKESDDDDHFPVISLSILVRQMDCLNHLKIPCDPSLSRSVWPMSTLFNHCQINTVSLCPIVPGIVYLRSFINFLKTCLPRWKHVESLIVEGELLYNFHLNKLDSSEKLTPDDFKDVDVSKLISLNIRIMYMKVEQYVILFKMLGNLSGLNMLQIHLWIVSSRSNFNETEFQKAKEDFMASHPQCKVFLRIGF